MNFTPPQDVKETISNTLNKESEMNRDDYNDQFWAEIREDYDLVISGTGSRSLQNEDANTRGWVVHYLRTQLRKLKAQHGDRLLVMAGGAEGFDSALAKSAMDEGIDFILAIPSPEYRDSYWSAPWKTSAGTQMGSVTGQERRDVFDKYVAAAKQVIYVCDFHQYGQANFVRNEYMAMFADGFYVWNPSSTGTRDCVRRIEAHKKKYVIVDERLKSHIEANS